MITTSGASEWSQRLGRVVAELAAARNRPELIRTVVTHAGEAVGATMATLSLVDAKSSTLGLIGIDGGSAAVERRWGSNALSAQIPACDALRARSMLVLSGRAAIAERYPGLLEPAEDEVSIVCLPLIAGDTALGVVGLRFPASWQPDAQGAEYLAMFAATCAQALQRIEALEDASASATKLALLAEASAELGSSLDYRSTLARVARLSVPTFGDWCAVAILDDGVLRTLAVEHVDPAKAEFAREMEARYPTDPEASTGAPNVVRTGVSELYPEVTDQMLVEGARDEEHLRLARSLGLHSVLIVPLAAHGRVLGTMTLASSESTRCYGPDDLLLAEDLARRAALAIDNAQLHSETREVALRLQRAVLPEPIADFDGWEVEGEYHPSGRTEVGGDFYDVVNLPDGRVVALMGDVVGRGVAAAAAMAQMRAAIRAYIATDPDPAVVMSKLDRMFELYGISTLVTLVYGVIDRAVGTAELINAGHPPPLLVRAAGVTLARTASAPPLGVSGAHRESTTWPIEAGTTLLLYTDGLIEVRGEDIEAGLTRLSQLATGLNEARLPAALSALVATVRDHHRDDDVSALAVRYF
ncbi:MAG: SpoIIE family protein phosphatase [Actinomycetota bacterium]|nr:SpoIIE family protein phosphatase [Actinomycetota bacterium]